MSTTVPPTEADRAPLSLPLERSHEEQMLREAVRGIVGDFGPDYFQTTARADRAPDELWAALAKGGYLGVHLPTAYGGGGLGLHELAIVVEETAAAGCPMLLMIVSPGIVGLIIARHGDEQQKQRWLTAIASGAIRVAFALTEPDAGTNSQNLKTTAREDGDGWLLNGQKYYISGAEEADQLLVVARTGVHEDGRGRLSLFLVDADAPGLTMQRIETALDVPERQWTLYFDDVAVPGDRLIGGAGNGLRAVFDGLNPERVLTSSLATGIGRYALAKAVAYARERAVWGAPIGSHQAVAHPLAESHIELELARLMTAKAAVLYDAGGNAGEAANVAKHAGSEAGIHALDRAMQAHGGNGMALEFQLSNYWFLVRMTRTGPVSREMVLNFVAEHTLGLPRSY